MTGDTPSCAARALEHIHALAEGIGARGSCTREELRGAEYSAQVMRDTGARDVAIEPFHAVPGTYRPYAVAFGLALFSTLFAWLWPGRIPLVLGALVHLAAAWGMSTESDLEASWIRNLLPKATGHNTVGVLPPSGEVHQRAVLCAHLDTHRTPIFYSSDTWQRLFGVLVTGAFGTLVAGVVVYGAGALFGWEWVRWIGLVTAAAQLVVLILSMHADFTPYSPGANDNASGVGVVLALAERLGREPLHRTEVWLALTDCEEVAAQGMVAFMDAHAAELGDDTLYVILDLVGVGHLTWLTVDGLIRKHKTHPLALDLARRSAAALPGIETGERSGVAYTDAVVATKRGAPALTLAAIPQEGAPASAYWHQMSDTVDVIDSGTLADACTFTWQVLREIDAMPGRRQR